MMHRTGRSVFDRTLARGEVWNKRNSRRENNPRRKRLTSLRGRHEALQLFGKVLHNHYLAIESDIRTSDHHESGAVWEYVVTRPAIVTYDVLIETAGGGRHTHVEKGRRSSEAHRLSVNIDRYDHQFRCILKLSLENDFPPARTPYGPSATARRNHD